MARAARRPTVARVGSGIIYAFLIVMWAAYFIPRWLRRHDELSESRSVEKFDAAMKILSRKESTPDRRYVVMPPRPDSAHRDRPSRPTRSPLTAPSRRPQPVRRPVSAKVRRRRILAGLLLTTFVATVLTPVTPLPWWLATLLLAVTVGDLVHLRLQVRRGREVDRTRQAVRRSMRSRLMRFDALDRLMSVRRELAEERAAEDARWADAEAAAERLREQEAREAAEAEGRWEPVPVPLPTYVTKPPAPRRAPAMDLSDPGAWSGTELPGNPPRWL